MNFYHHAAFLSLLCFQYCDVPTCAPIVHVPDTPRMSSIMGAELAHMKVEASMMLAVDQSKFLIMTSQKLPREH